MGSRELGPPFPQGDHGDSESDFLEATQQVWGALGMDPGPKIFLLAPTCLLLLPPPKHFFLRTHTLGHLDDSVAEHLTRGF